MFCSTIYYLCDLEKLFNSLRLNSLIYKKGTVVEPSKEVWHEDEIKSCVRGSAWCLTHSKSSVLGSCNSDDKNQDGRGGRGRAEKEGGEGARVENEKGHRDV